MHYVLWNGFLAIIALVAFAAMLEGFLFAALSVALRMLLAPAIVLVFWPDFRLELVGVIVMLGVLGLNWSAGRKIAS